MFCIVKDDKNKAVVVVAYEEILATKVEPLDKNILHNQN